MKKLIFALAVVGLLMVARPAPAQVGVQVGVGGFGGFNAPFVGRRAFVGHPGFGFRRQAFANPGFAFRQRAFVHPHAFRQRAFVAPYMGYGFQAPFVGGGCGFQQGFVQPFGYGW